MATQAVGQILEIETQTAGDAWELEIFGENLRSGFTVVEAWFTVEHTRGEAVGTVPIRQHITAAASSAGQVTDNGASTGTAVLLFQVPPSLTGPLNTNTDGSSVQFKTGLEVLLSDGAGTYPRTPGAGTLDVLPPIVS